PLTVEGAALGRLLFHEKALSADGSLACASCHKQEFAFADSTRFSVGMGGMRTSRNSMPLMNLAWDHFFFWDARALSLELQAFEPVTAHREMGSRWSEVSNRLAQDKRYPQLFAAAFGDARIDSLRVAFALAQFERTMVSLSSRFDRYFYMKQADALNAQERRGKDIFFTRAHCVDCHEPPLFKGHHVVNIGLDSVPADLGMGGRTGMPWHMGRFKTPTLRNIAATAPYMHDGRFATLEEVVDFYADGVNVNATTLDEHMLPWRKGDVRLSQQDCADLVAFLHTLTDSAFLADKRFGPPQVP
ncbi:MAG TPA: cytochrome c peroxidase, partial [Flavobacteriales bacterium]|nr:cytochrome c peroxidase [Flavobacteriales bacterium]